VRRQLASANVPPFEVRLENGSIHRLAGAAHLGDSEPRFRITIRRPAGLRALRSLDELGLGFAYVCGALDVDGDFLSSLDLRGILTDRRPVHSLFRFLGPIVLGQRDRDFTWIARHYDRGNDFYFAFLDKQYRMYSQALFMSDDEPLEQAARNKLEYIVEVCRLGAGSRVLDIGGGWGAFEQHAGTLGVDATMLTLSREQFGYLSAWCRSHTMPCRLSVLRESIFTFEPGEQYDAIVMLGSMEHLPDYRRLMPKLGTLLKPGGRVYMDFAAGRRMFDVSSFTSRYVFEGNHSPVYLPDLFSAAIAGGFEPVALHNDRHSYYLTLRAWALNLEAARDRVLPLVGEQGYRLFRLFLWGGAHGLARDGNIEAYRVVFQRAVGRPSSEIGCYRPA
jgi:cyclopropane-fatty-acyl-phospholipid synthase